MLNFVAPAVIGSNIRMVVCPNFGALRPNFVIPGVRTDYNSKAETRSKLTVHSQLLQKCFSHANLQNDIL